MDCHYWYGHSTMKITYLHTKNTTAPINNRLNVVVLFPTPFGLGRNDCCLPEGPNYSGHSPHTNHFLPCFPLNDRDGAVRSLFEIGRLSSLFSCLSLARLLILLLLLMSGNVHPNPGPVFPYSVRAGNVTWRGRLGQCSFFSKWAQLRCLLLFFSRFKTLGCSHCWSFPPCCVLASFGDPTSINAVLLPRTSLTSISPLFNLAHLVPLC